MRLGRHAIAIVQTTAIDQEAGLVRLNTVLAHASGEWVASEWPVCRIGDMASPQRMGAALTYARRYALFTLVGIAGEDDLDAPDLGAPREPEAGSPTEPNGRSEPKRGVVTVPANGSRGRKRPPAPKRLLQPDASAVLREQLLIESAAIASADEAAVWARRKLPAKNTLTPADADIIEQAFRAKLQSVERIETDQAAPPPPSGDQHDKFDARPEPSSPYRCAASTTAICIAAATKRHGGRLPKSSRWRLLKGSGARRGIKGGDGICGAHFRLSFSRTERHLKQRRFVYARPDQLAVLAGRRAALSSWASVMTLIHAGIAPHRYTDMQGIKRVESDLDATLDIQTKFLLDTNCASHARLDYEIPSQM